MLTLIQYEMKKTAFMKILCFSALLIAQAFVLLGGATDNYVVLGLGAGLLIFFSFLIFFILGLSSMASLSKDLNTTQGYMLFMLPKHSACFLLAKIIESLISTFLAGVLVFLLFSFNVVYFSLDMEFYQDAFELFWNERKGIWRIKLICDSLPIYGSSLLDFSFYDGDSLCYHTGQSV